MANGFVRFAYRLGKETGHLNIEGDNGILSTLSWSQFCGWLAYYQLEPWGEVIEDHRAGNIAAAIYNVNRAKKSSKLWSWVDFMTRPKPEKKHKPITNEGWQRFKAALLKGKGKPKTPRNPPDSLSSS